MSYRHCQIAGVLIFCLSASVIPATVEAAVFDCKVHVPDCVKKCCDDYCPKTIPCTRTAKIGCCDDYCGKPVPCSRGICQRCCDNYRSKCEPMVSCPPRKLTCRNGSVCPSRP